jgi:hypothetical protein
MVYDSEKNLIEDFKRSFIGSLIRTENTLILDGIDTSWGRVDLLIIQYDHIKYLKRQSILKNKEIAPFTNLAAYAISYIIENPFCNSEQLRNFLKTKNGIFLETIDNLINRELIHSYSNNTFRAKALKNIYFIKQIQAFEAKLNNWKRAIDQAERHLWFTNSSYIVLPNISEFVKKKVKYTCTERGIGLILQNSHNRFKKVKRPPNKQHIDSILSWKLNESLIDGLVNNG